MRLCPQACPSPLNASVSNDQHAVHVGSKKPIKLTVLSIKRNHRPTPPTIKHSHKRRGNFVRRWSHSPVLQLLFSDEIREDLVRVNLFIPDLGMVVDVQGQGAERSAERVDVLAYEGRVAVGVVVAADSVGCGRVNHGVLGVRDGSFTMLRMVLRLM